MTRTTVRAAAGALLVACLAAGAAAAEPAYLTEQWPDARVLTWDVSKNKGDASEPGNWLENGAPATTLFDRDTDLVLPPGSRLGRFRAGRIECRHLTLQEGAEWFASKVPATIHGSLDIGPGARIYFQPLTFAGGKHTFCRNVNTFDTMKGERMYLGPWVMVEKTGGASIEFLGHVASGDELKFNEGVAIVGEDSWLTAGPASIQIVGPEATLEVQSGGRFTKRRNAGHDNPDILVQGTLRGGSPERPLAAHAWVGVSTKANETQQKGFEPERGSYRRGPNKYTSRFIANDGSLAAVGMIVEPGGRLEVHSVDPQRARLNIIHHGFGGDPALGIKILLLGEVRADGLGFDHVAAGGLLAPDPAALSGADIAYGPNVAGAPDTLWAAYAP